MKNTRTAELEALIERGKKMLNVYHDNATTKMIINMIEKYQNEINRRKQA